MRFSARASVEVGFSGGVRFEVKARARVRARVRARLPRGRSVRGDLGRRPQPILTL